MKVKQIIMMHESMGLPTLEKKTERTLTLHLYWRTFEWEGGKYPYSDIEHLGHNLYALKTCFRLHDFCFRPKWYQILKFSLYFNAKKLVELAKFIKKLMKTN